ncbi:MAG: hydrolase, partial [Kiloniellales bacterium]|nr:hydrolase [Kiloniellales bacterium]
VGSGYKALEQRLLAAIHLRFGLPPHLPVDISRLIKRADRAAAYLEATHLAGFSEKDAKGIFSKPRGIDGNDAEITDLLVPLSPAQAKKRFLRRFHALFS